LYGFKKSVWLEHIEIHLLDENEPGISLRFSFSDEEGWAAKNFHEPERKDEKYYLSRMNSEPFREKFCLF